MELYWRKIKRLEKELIEERKTTKLLLEQLDGEMEKTEFFRKSATRAKKAVIAAAESLKEKEEDFKRTVAFMELKNLSDGDKKNQ